MREPRPEKVAVVADVYDRFETGTAAVFSEYRGLDVAALAELRRALRQVGGEHKIYKNTLVRLAAARHGLDIEHLLSGPTAITFVTEQADGSPADPAAVAKALREFARAHTELVLKGAVLDQAVLGPDELRTLAELPSREVLLAHLAGAFAAPMARLAGLMGALPRDFAYGLKALIDSGGPDGGGSDSPSPDHENDGQADSAPSGQAAAEASEQADSAGDVAETGTAGDQEAMSGADHEADGQADSAPSGQAAAEASEQADSAGDVAETGTAGDQEAMSGADHEADGAAEPDADAQEPDQADTQDPIQDPDKEVEQ